MKYLNEDEQYRYFLWNFKGNTVRIRQNKSTGEALFNTDDVARVFGFDNVSDMLNSDENLMNAFLDAFSEGKIKTI